MAALMTRDAALAVIRDTIESDTPIENPASQRMAEGIYGALIVGYVMDDTAFIAIHGHRLVHLTRKSLTAAGLDIPSQPGERPRNI